MFGHIMDWRRVHTRYERCAYMFNAAIVIAAIITF